VKLLFVCLISVFGLMLFIESLHLKKHSEHCKTDSEWARHYGISKDELARMRWELNN
jgi:hypothetical protein